MGRERVLLTLKITIALAIHSLEGSLSRSLSTRLILWIEERDSD